MKSRILTCIIAMALFAILAIPVRVAAQGHIRYMLKDTGTLGGPNSFLGFEQSRNINNQGAIAAASDTSVLATPPFCLNDCYVEHATKWRNGVLTDLGTLPDGNGGSSWISDTGQIAGLSLNGVIDPLTGSPELKAVLWKDGQVIDLGTFGGNDSIAESVNDQGQVVGFALNAVPDPFSGFGTQQRAFLWQNGTLKNLGTLGGPDSNAFIVNERGQVTGYSLTNSTPNPTTGFPTQDPFLWDHGNMIDLGTLGGTFGFPNWLNNRGQVVGLSNLAGDLVFHPFLWDRGKLTDLGTLGGSTGDAIQINDAGDVVGVADLPGDQIHHAFLWRNGVLTDLGSLGETSFAFALNSQDQVVGASQINATLVHAFLWENGSIIDLNRFVPSGSGVQLTFALSINERGEIASLGVLPNGDQHAFLLTPCSGDQTNAQGCQGTPQSTTVVTQAQITAIQGSLEPSDLLKRILGRFRPWQAHE